MSHTRCKDGGFTLVEVLVAFVIVAVSLGALLQIFSSGLRSSHSAEAYTTAALLAESKLASIGIEEPLEEGETTGAFDNGFRWRSTVAPHAPEVGQDEASAAQAYEVTLVVRWGERGDERSVSLTTLRLAPKPGP